jgi:hypothetical protein
MIARHDHKNTHDRTSILTHVPCSTGLLKPGSAAIRDALNQGLFHENRDKKEYVAVIFTK